MTSSQSAQSPHPNSRCNLTKRLAPRSFVLVTFGGMGGPHTFSVTMVRPSTGLPSFEVGAYEYVGERLPYVGETIPVRKVVGPDGGDEVRGYVTRVDPNAGTPISVTHVAEPAPTIDDVVV